MEFNQLLWISHGNVLYFLYLIKMDQKQYNQIRLENKDL